MIEIEAQDDPATPPAASCFSTTSRSFTTCGECSTARRSSSNIIGKSAAIEQVWQLIRDFARVDSTVLIEGDTGVGKELGRPRDSQSKPAKRPAVCRAQLRRA